MSVQKFEELPLFSRSLKIMKFWSFILVHNWRRYVCLTPTVLLNLSQFADMYFTVEPIDAIIRNAYILVLWFNTIMRAVLLIINRERYEKFMADLNEVYMDLQANEDKEMKQLLAQTTRSAKNLATMNLALGTLACVGFNLYPVFTSSRVLPFGMYIPGLNKYKSPWYEALYVFQTVITPMGCCMYIPFTNLVVAFIMFAILMCKVLQHHLRNLSTLKREEVWPQMVWCIRFQLQILRYVEIVNSLTTYIYLVEYLALGALLCALLFLLNMVRSIGQVIIVSAYIIMIFSQIAAMYWYANELYHQSVGVSQAAYESNWFEFDMGTQKALLMFISKAQQPCAILVGNIYPMTLEMFQSLLNTTYTYFTLLRRFYE